ncbi:ATP/GTP-binding protein [Streptomyces sp. NPDC088146]|uniref:ATP/GTP-binding protein n=1 Tax=Streptomyces sp. NPDC088146 TaxID=3365829 RepID=UPI00381E1D87
MMEQNAKLHTATMKAKADKTAARGKADAARSSGSGMGSDKGRSKAGGGGLRGGGGSSGGSGRGAGGGRSSGSNGSGSSGRGSGGGNSPKGAGKGSDRPAGGRGGGSKGNESSGGPKGRQNGSGGSGSGKSGTGKGSSGGSGGKNGGSGNSGSGKGGSKSDGGKPQNSPAPGPGPNGPGGRQERAAARQAARQQRRSADQAAHLADRSKDRDQDRANRQAEREERRAAKAERKAAREAKREAAKAADERTTLGQAAAEEAQRRWDERHQAEKDKAADSTSDKDSKDGPEKPSDGPDGDRATKESGDDRKGGEEPFEGSGDKGSKDGSEPDDVKDPPGPGGNDGRSFKERLHDFFAKAAEAQEPPSRATPEDLGFTVDSPGRSSRPPKPGPAEEEIWDAVIVDDPADPFRAGVSSPASLPPAPEPHTQRPGTTRPTAQEDPVTGQTGMAANHRTDITFDKFLMEIVNIAIAADLDKDRAEDLAAALGKVADALRDMAADLVGDHNIATEVVDQITDLADAASRMKALAEQCATECGIASQGARITAISVGLVYGEDIKAMDDAGLANASSAAHHD